MNDQNRKQVIILVVLVVLAAVVAFWQLGKSTADVPPAAPSAAQQPAGAAAPAQTAQAPQGPVRLEQDQVDVEALLEDIEVVRFDYDLERIDRNPMSPLVGEVFNIAEEEQGGRPQETPSVVEVLRKSVTAIVWDQVDPVAVVDNEVVYEGYSYANGTRIVDIRPDTVIFQVGDAEIPVKMKEF